MDISPKLLKISLSHISALMKKFREEKTRLTQDDVAKGMGVSRAYIHQLESGKINYSFGACFSASLIKKHDVSLNTTPIRALGHILIKKGRVLISLPF